MQKIIYSSQLGTLIGVNKYKSRKRLLFDYFNMNKKSLPKNVPYPCNYKIIGINNESRILKEFESKYNIKCYPVDKQMSEICNWVIKGKCDGITSVGSLIEVKCRMKEISDTIDGNDYAQIQSYLQIYGVDKCFYVQSLFDSKEIHVKIIQKDFDYWENVVKPKIIEFNDIYDQMAKCINLLET